MIAKTFAVFFGAFLGLALLKFGTPPVMDKLVSPPTSKLEWVVFVWPLRVAYGLMGLLLVGGLFAVKFKRFAPGWLMLMPFVWFCWQLFAASQSVDAQLSQSVLLHFSGCVVCFYLGALGIGKVEVRRFFLLPLLCGFTGTLLLGLEQHFGGLQQTRDYFWTYLYPAMANVPPEYVKKMQSNRIFSTVFYPNAFAGALLLLTPVLLTWTWQAKRNFTAGARVLLCGMMVVGASACLYWSGSKGGWLLAVLIVAAAVFHQTIPPRIKIVLLLVLVVCGGAGFYWKNREYMHRGATSVVARFDYWRAAWQTAVGKPVFGSGPGTFAQAYQAVKKPESEMARLTHNDYLEQASDSGFPGLVTYSAFVVGLLCVIYRRLDWRSMPIECAAWLGLAAWACQSAFEFFLYVPSLAWAGFALAGWLLGTTRETNRQTQPAVPTLQSK